MSGNYYRKLWASIYPHAKNVGIIYRDTGVSNNGLKYPKQIITRTKVVHKNVSQGCN